MKNKIQKGTRKPVQKSVQEPARRFPKPLITWAGTFKKVPKTRCRSCRQLCIDWPAQSFGQYRRCVRLPQHFDAESVQQGFGGPQLTLASVNLTYFRAGCGLNGPAHSVAFISSRYLKSIKMDAFLRNRTRHHTIQNTCSLPVELASFNVFQTARVFKNQIQRQIKKPLKKGR